MRHFLLTGAATAAIVATSFAAQAMPAGVPSLDGLSPIENVAICFYVDGWHGPGMYQCGFRRREGRGWVGERREERREFAARTAEATAADRRDDRRGDR